MKKNVIFKYRQNAHNAVFYQVMVMDLAEIQNYTHAAENAKSIKSAVSKINKSYKEKYEKCYRNYAVMADAGKFSIPEGLEDFSVTKYTREELLAEVNELFGKEVADAVAKVA